jgi:CelD/BcsL family acetyltransferase involved in cellulose biosynthesis
MRNDHTFYYDVLVLDKFYDEVIGSLNEYIRINHISFINFDNLSINSQFLIALRRFLQDNHTMSLCETNTFYGCPFIAIEGSWDSFWNTFSSNFRTNLKKREKAIRKLGDIEVSEIGEHEHIKEILLECFKIEALGWKKENGTAILCDDDVKNFYLEFCESISAKGLLKVFFLTLNKKRIAFSICMEYKNTLYSCKVGYDLSLSKYSPGSILRKEIIRKLFSENRVAKLDLLGSYEVWKRDWTSHSVEFKQVVLFRHNIRSIISLIVAHNGMLVVKHLAKQLKIDHLLRVFVKKRKKISDKNNFVERNHSNYFGVKTSKE